MTAQTQSAVLVVLCYHLGFSAAVVKSAASNVLLESAATCAAVLLSLFAACRSTPTSISNGNDASLKHYRA
jgi:hypothetical protein